ncbi:hypothetical protein [Bartonella sp. WD16.2]|uniref:hypothetical protein n=1 Tax=Bartonella sp. WD16.2 TaxID=1933904 RepID=UPI0009C2D69B|nr:collagen, type III, alpha [Bartonella sp. WD16.2]
MDSRPGLAKGGNGSPGTQGMAELRSGHGGNAGGDTSRGGCEGTGSGRYFSGKPGRGFGGGGAGAHWTGYPSGPGANGAVLIRIWKKPYEKDK